MTVTGISIPSITDEARSKRLIDASIFWNERIAEDTSSALLTYKVSGEAIGSVASRIQAGRHVFHIDEPAGLAGDDLAASPVEIALGAFIACQIVVYRLYAQHLGVRIDAISADVEGDLDVRGLFGIDASVRPGFSEIRLTTHISGPESNERYAELQGYVDSHCPVLDLFANPTPLKLNLIVNQ